jgi:hypothetical protein
MLQINSKPLLLITIILLIVGVGIYLQPKNPEIAHNSSTETITPSPAPQYEFTATESGISALELTKKNVQVDLEQFDFGAMIRSVDQIVADDKHYWALYLNNQYAETAADKTILNQGDTIKWIYEEITP